MDAHLFHTLSPSLEKLVGARIVKIYQYDIDIYVFCLYNLGKKQYLIARTGKNMPFLFLTDEHTPRGEEPPAHVMRLRKHLKGRRIINMYSAWWERILFFQVKQEEGAEPLWFKIDLKKGVDICFNGKDNPCINPENLYPKPLFPLLENIEKLQELLEIKERKFSPFLTPSLRKTIQAMLEIYLDKNEALLEVKSLLIDLEDGNGDIFIYTTKHENLEDNKQEVYAWQLPDTLKINKEEEIFENAIFALNEFGKRNLLKDFTNELKKDKSKPYLNEIKKLNNLKQKLIEDEARLISMCEQKELALLIQSHLYNLDKNTKTSELLLNDNIYKLNSKLTILENMENLFHQSLRGKRGLIFLEERKQKIDIDIDIAKEKLKQAVMLAQIPNNISITEKTIKNNKPEKNTNNTKPLSKKKELQKNVPKQVLVRESEDGFAILLGKDTKGNALALKLASAHDYWLHTADGASAHAIIKRDHNAHVVPESTFVEAGRMVAEKSPFKNDEKALIQYSLAKNIQFMKNSTTLVRINKSEGSYWVSLN